MKKLLWLDDLRDPIVFLDQEYFKTHLVKWVKSYDGFVEYIKVNNLPDIISFDHDLGINDDGTEKNGKDCANFLIEYCMDNNLPLPQYKVHSANPVGLKNISSLFDNFNKIFK